MSNHINEGNKATRWRVPPMAILGYLIAIGGMAWVLHDIRIGDVWPYMSNLKWRWILPAVGLDLLTYAMQGYRWELLLRQVGRLSPWKAAEAIYAGLFTNEVLPLRVGEVVRAYLVSRWLGVQVLRVVPSMAVERLFDGLWLAAAVGVTALAVPLPSQLERAAEVLGASTLALTVGLAVWLMRPGAADVGGSRVRRAFRVLEVELREIGLSKRSYAAFVASGVLPAAQAGAFWCAMKAYHLQLPGWAAVVVFLVVRLGTMVPNAPANIGSFQFFCVLGLMLFRIDKTVATGFSLAMFLVLTVPLWLLGMLAFGRSGMSLATVKQQMANPETKMTAL
ncbi:MAG TPA: lysylphosphatidylglycerol synthase transmembrane domain-containing protein [Terriglobales bacterium]|nr:lysylphosphatidylglycerol synthase transmembrane domain-containing protein [Terriglobales bacterium]